MSATAAAAAAMRRQDAHARPIPTTYLNLLIQVVQVQRLARVLGQPVRPELLCSSLVVVRVCPFGISCRARAAVRRSRNSRRIRIVLRLVLYCGCPRGSSNRVSHGRWCGCEMRGKTLGCCCGILVVSKDVTVWCMRAAASEYLKRDFLVIYPTT